MRTGSPLAFRLNLAKPDSSMPLIIRLLNAISRLASLDSCREEIINGMVEHMNVNKIPNKADVVLVIFDSPFMILFSYNKLFEQFPFNIVEFRACGYQDHIVLIKPFDMVRFITLFNIPFGFLGASV